jgi:hypothetical protein
MTPATDEQLIKDTRKQFADSIAKLFREMAKTAECRCDNKQHGENSSCCPKAIWQMAARMAIGFVEFARSTTTG